MTRAFKFLLAFLLLTLSVNTVVLAGDDPRKKRGVKKAGFAGMDRAGGVVWKFKKTTDVVPNMQTLKQKVLSSLGTWDGQRWVASNELNALFNQPGITTKLTAVFDAPCTNCGRCVTSVI